MFWRLGSTRILCESLSAPQTSFSGHKCTKNVWRPGVKIAYCIVVDFQYELRGLPRSIEMHRFVSLLKQVHFVGYNMRPLELLYNKNYNFSNCFVRKKFFWGTFGKLLDPQLLDRGCALEVLYKTLVKRFHAYRKGYFTKPL